MPRRRPLLTTAALSGSDNLVAAMDTVAQTMSPTRNPAVGTPDKPAQKQILIRATDEDHQRWKDAAQRCGVSMSEYVRRVVNERTAELLDCLHPVAARKTYPWAEFCTACGQRLRG